ncbi:MAG TPA: electron transfer flavoprotein subunit beta/FixA family protein [Stenomitos sp.]
MRVVVCLKPVPDPREPWRFDPVRQTLVRDSSEGILNPQDDLALEAALRWRDAGLDLDCWALTMGAQSARDILKRALAKGADHAVWLHDPDLAGSDLLATTRALTAAIRRIGVVDLVLMGDRSLDAGTGALGAMLAEALGWPHLAGAEAVSVSADRLTATRQGTRDRLQCAWPAVASVAALAGGPRLPSFTGIMATAKKEPVTWTRADLGLAPEEVGLGGSATRVIERMPSPGPAQGEVSA